MSLVTVIVLFGLLAALLTSVMTRRVEAMNARQQEHEQHFRSLFDHNPDAVFTLDKRGCFEEINEAVCEFLKLPKEEILGQHYNAVVAEEDLERTDEHFSEALKGNPQRYEIHIHNALGEEMALNITNMPIVVDGKITGVHGIAKDLTEFRQNWLQLKTLQRGVDASPNGIVIADAREEGYPIIYINPAFERITGYSSEEMLGGNCKVLQGVKTDPRTIKQISNRLKAQKEVNTPILNYRKDGTPFWNELHISPVKDHTGKVTHFIGIQNDVTDKKLKEDQLSFHASHDPLTGLPNRSLLEDRLQNACKLAKRYKHYLSVLFIDLDGFKPINDSLGHNIGDALLQEVGRRLQAEMREGDTVARFGGDEFVVVLAETGEPEQVVNVVERLLQKVAEPYTVGDHQLTVTASIGITTSDGNLNAPNELIQQADMAMYKAKRGGHNNYQWFTSDINAKVSRIVAMRNELHDALEHNQLELYYQPVFASDGQTVAALEALVRWNHPEKGLILPAEFIPLAEQTGQIVALSEWVIQTACENVKQLDKTIKLPVSINISPVQFNRSNFIPVLEKALKKTGISGGSLEIEVTENILMHDSEQAINLLKQAKNLGIGIAIDDFGIGYSSLSYLQELPVDKIKIDKSFVQRFEQGGRNSAITLGIIAMAKKMDLNVVVEGIETESLYQKLKQHEPDFYQGFYFAHPMPFSKLKEFLQNPELRSVSGRGSLPGARRVKAKILRS